MDPPSTSPKIAQPRVADGIRKEKSLLNCTDQTRSTILNGFLSPRLSKLLTPAELQAISDSVQFVNGLPDTIREAVRKVFCDGYNEQLRVMLYFSVGAWLSTLLLWEKKLKRAKDIEGY